MAESARNRRFGLCRDDGVLVARSLLVISRQQTPIKRQAVVDRYETPQWMDGCGSAAMAALSFDTESLRSGFEARLLLLLFWGYRPTLIERTSKCPQSIDASASPTSRTASDLCLGGDLSQRSHFVSRMVPSNRGPMVCVPPPSCRLRNPRKKSLFFPTKDGSLARTRQQCLQHSPSSQQLSLPPL